MNPDQIQGSARQVVLAFASSALGDYVLKRFGISVGDFQAFVGFLVIGACWIWQMAHHKETDIKAKENGV